MLTVRLPADLERRLDALVKRAGRSKSSFVREAICEHIEDLELTSLAEERQRTDMGERIPLGVLLSRYADDLGAEER